MTEGKQISAATCEAKVWGHGYWHQYPCSRKATTEVGGKHYCTQHAKKAEKDTDA